MWQFCKIKTNELSNNWSDEAIKLTYNIRSCAEKNKLKRKRDEFLFTLTHVLRALFRCGCMLHESSRSDCPMVNVHNTEIHLPKNINYYFLMTEKSTALQLQNGLSSFKWFTIQSKLFLNALEYVHLPYAYNIFHHLHTHAHKLLLLLLLSISWIGQKNILFVQLNCSPSFSFVPMELSGQILILIGIYWKRTHPHTQTDFIGCKLY